MSPPTDRMENPGTLRLLALGDSYTIGEQVDRARCWPVRLAGLLRSRGLLVAQPVIVAQTGWTTAELAHRLDDDPPRGPFDLVTLLIGVNNQYRGLPVGAYRLEFRDLLARAVDFAGGDAARVLVLSIPDWGLTPFAADRDPARISAEIDGFNAVNRSACAVAGVRYVDVTPLSRDLASVPGMLAPDGLHPSGAQYARWARAVLPAALLALEPSPPSRTRDLLL